MKDLSSFQPRRILICQQRQIGDVLLATPVFQLLKQRFPQAELHLFTEPKCEAPIILRILMEISVGSAKGIITFHKYFKSLVPSTFAARYNSLGICIKF